MYILVISSPYINKNPRIQPKTFLCPRSAVFCGFGSEDANMIEMQMNVLQTMRKDSEGCRVSFSALKTYTLLRLEYQGLRIEFCSRAT